MKLTAEQTSQLKACRATLEKALDSRLENPSSFESICHVLKKSGECAKMMEVITHYYTKTLTSNVDMIDKEADFIKQELSELKQEMKEIMLDETLLTKNMLLLEEEPRISSLNVLYTKKKTKRDVKVGTKFDSDAFNLFNDAFGVSEYVDKSLFTTSVFKNVKVVEEVITYTITFSDKQKLSWTSSDAPAKLAEIKTQFEQKMAELQTDSRPALTC